MNSIGTTGQDRFGNGEIIWYSKESKGNPIGEEDSERIPLLSSGSLQKDKGKVPQERTRAGSLFQNEGKKPNSVARSVSWDESLLEKGREGNALRGRVKSPTAKKGEKSPAIDQNSSDKKELSCCERIFACFQYYLNQDFSWEPAYGVHVFTSNGETYVNGVRVVSPRKDALNG